MNPTRQFWFEKLRWPIKYEHSFYNAIFSHDGIQVFELSKDTSLIQIQTYKGAYQPAHIYMLYHSSIQKSHLISFPFHHHGKMKFQNEIAGFEKFNSKTKTISIFSKSRGLGDCGRWGKWAFKKNKNSYILKLIELRSQSCSVNDKASKLKENNPPKWPLVWPQSL